MHIISLFCGIDDFFLAVVGDTAAWNTPMPLKSASQRGDDDTR
jgi:hypothetical protein